MQLNFTQLSFIVLSTVQLVSSLWNPIHDCDETFNYWEPTHYLLHQYGLQTWEYSPAYCLRSYFYIGIHALLGHLFSFLAPLLPAAAAAPFFLASPKIAVFYLIRAALGLVAAMSQTVFLRGVYTRFGPLTARYALGFLALSPGVFFSSTAFLPSSFCMVAYFFAFGHYFRGNHFSAVLFGSMGVLLAWPFPLIMLLPMALDLIRLHGFPKVLLWAVTSAVVWLVPSVLIDYAFYRKLVLAILRIFVYNATSNVESGSQLYGTEPFSFYFVNGFLNFNVVWLLALVSPLVLLFLKNAHEDVARPFKPPWSLPAHLAPMFAWLALMLYLPHKEERFLYVIYPMVVLNAALSLVVLLRASAILVQRLLPRSPRLPSLARLFQLFLLLAVVLVFALLSLSRILALTSYYSAPLHMYGHFNDP
ncbi:MAG: hypothetical protein Q8P67_10605, partial [archaeon]|nr:hypothetical protein [archaeon]